MAQRKELTASQWAKLIAADPGVVLASGSNNDQAIAAQTARDNQLAALIARRGGVDALRQKVQADAAGQYAPLKGLGNDWWTNVQKIASDYGPYTTEETLAQQNLDARDAINNNLAARGILSSGEWGYQQDRQARDYGRRLSDADLALFGDIAGVESTFATGAQSRADAVQKAKQSAIDRIAKLWASGGYDQDYGLMSGGSGSSASATGMAPRAYGPPAPMAYVSPASGATVLPPAVAANVASVLGGARNTAMPYPNMKAPGVPLTVAKPAAPKVPAIPTAAQTALSRSFAGRM